MGLLKEARDITNKLENELLRQGALVVFCYNRATVWQDRSLAAEFYREAVLMCDGCEKERYMNVLMDIMDGNCICHDGVTAFLTREVEYR